MGSLAPSRFALWREEERRGRGREGERGRKGKREGEMEVERGRRRRRVKLLKIPSSAVHSMRTCRTEILLPWFLC